MNTAGVTSLVHLTVLDMVAVLPQPSVAVNVLVLARLHPSLTTGPSEDVMVTEPQAFVAVAEPSEPSGLAGLQPRFTSPKVPVNVAALPPLIHLTVLDMVDVLPQASLAVNVLVLEKLHPLLTTLPSLDVIVTAPHASVAVAVPSDASGLAGLHPRLTSP